MSDTTTPKYLLRKDTDNRYQNLFIIGPYEYGAEQLYVNGYNFIGEPPSYLSEMVSLMHGTLSVISSVFGLTEPTIYFVAHPRFPKRIAAFIGESSPNPMIALMTEKFIKEGFPADETPVSFFLRIMVHELMHAHVERVFGLGNSYEVEEEVILEWEAKFGKAKGKAEVRQVLHDFVAMVAGRFKTAS